MGHSPWGHKESDTTEQLNSNKNIVDTWFFCVLFFICFSAARGFLAARGLSLAAAARAAHVVASFLPSVGSGRTGVSGGIRVNCPAACAVSPEQRLEPRHLHWRLIHNHRTTREAICRYMFAELEKNTCGSFMAQSDCPSSTGSRGCLRTGRPSATLSRTRGQRS